MTKNADDHTQPSLWDTGGTNRRAEAATTARTKPSASRAHDRHATSIEVDDLWSIDQVAGYLGVPKQTIYCWRTSGYGPQGFRVGKHLRWRAATVLSWTADLERQQ